MELSKEFDVQMRAQMIKKHASTTVDAILINLIALPIFNMYFFFFIT